ncbi:hypothetical protein I8751_29560 [Nostocaceae cyanobacterium CENA357]|uniref:Uncharacterized protein n=1 Tax=Atlanticothrix silvestris CENA357 TaxID=1725252 RepID=A0A8J7L4V9_9CYAN|nr:hypothetical protein [Atlanticothrix silvestris CENA357]
MHPPSLSLGDEQILCIRRATDNYIVLYSAIVDRRRFEMQIHYSKEHIN